MKRYLTFIAIMLCAIGSAQNLNDVLRYSSENLQGSARFQSMSGAFGALGGDLSALNVNPAGAAVFNNSLFGFSGTNYNRNNEATYFNGFASTKLNSLEFNQIGGVIVFKTNSESPWRKLTLAVNYDLAENYDNEIFIAGNSSEGIDNYFLDFAQGAPFGSILLRENEYLEDAYLDIGAQQSYADQQAFLGYYGGIINPVDETDDNNTAYTSNSNYTSVNQELVRQTSGYNSKFVVNGATQYGENLYIGASLNFHTILYNRYDEFTEDGYDAGSPTQFTTFDNFLHTEGNGFSFSIGAIGKLNDLIRLGASYQSPTWYRLTDDFAQKINSTDAVSDINFINYDIVNLFEAYNVKTPGKLTGSLAFIFGKNGLLSLDYGYQDLSSAKIKPTSDPNFATVNNDIGNNLSQVSSIRLGGEYRIQRFSLRAGYRYEQSPFADGRTIGDLNGYSGGLGINFRKSRLDLSLNRTEQEVSESLFDTGITTPAILNKINTNVTVGYTVNF
ncbi:outer membrane protein transport protein [Aurantibacter crassamenti]|uniref:OmpP1/FadL family transporter n=1 Tax=Aurantibacter crassamenti TaxID=1837375 RepID=UPI00193A1A26|nr:outer membrane protein transport protein [Aurantibacter crassamenti]MBM1106268.1 outer membrane protein transport protein [Aurantibacter crassamenti]